jgi:hypothetical protein
MPERRFLPPIFFAIHGFQMDGSLTLIQIKIICYLFNNLLSCTKLFNRSAVFQ